MAKIKIAIVGIGNCASSLIQGTHYYREKAPHDAIGLMHWKHGGYRPGDIEVVERMEMLVDRALEIEVDTVGDGGRPASVGLGRNVTRSTSFYLPTNS